MITQLYLTYALEKTTALLTGTAEAPQELVTRIERALASDQPSVIEREATEISRIFPDLGKPELMAIVARLYGRNHSIRKKAGAPEQELMEWQARAVEALRGAVADPASKTTLAREAASDGDLSSLKEIEEVKELLRLRKPEVQQ